MRKKMIFVAMENTSIVVQGASIKTKAAIPLDGEIRKFAIDPNGTFVIFVEIADYAGRAQYPAEEHNYEIIPSGMSIVDGEYCDTILHDKQVFHIYEIEPTIETPAQMRQ